MGLPDFWHNVALVGTKVLFSQCLQASKKLEGTAGLLNLRQN